MNRKEDIILAVEYSNKLYRMYENDKNYFNDKERARIVIENRPFMIKNFVSKEFLENNEDIIVEAINLNNKFFADLKDEGDYLGMLLCHIGEEKRNNSNEVLVALYKRVYDVIVHERIKTIKEKLRSENFSEEEISDAIEDAFGKFFDQFGFSRARSFLDKRKQNKCNKIIEKNNVHKIYNKLRKQIVNAFNKEYICQLKHRYRIQMMKEHGNDWMRYSSINYGISPEYQIKTDFAKNEIWLKALDDYMKLSEYKRRKLLRLYELGKDDKKSEENDKEEEIEKILTQQEIIKKQQEELKKSIRKRDE